MADSGNTEQLIRPILGHRLLIGLLVGLIVWGVTLIVAWRSTRGVFRSQQWYTQFFILQDIKEKIQVYHDTYGSDPNSLNDLVSDNERGYRSGTWYDDWDHPLVSHVEDGKLVVTSFGRDGKPGGVGLDYDLTQFDPLHPPLPGALPTLGQFLFDLAPASIHTWSAVNGLFLFVVVMMDANKPKSKPDKWGYVLIECLIAGVATSIVGGLLMVVHLSGH